MNIASGQKWESSSLTKPAASWNECTLEFHSYVGKLLDRWDQWAYVGLRFSQQWDLTPYSLAKANWCFRGTHCLHLQGQQVHQANNTSKHSKPWGEKRQERTKRRRENQSLVLTPKRAIFAEVDRVGEWQGATGSELVDEGREKGRNGCRETLNVEWVHSSETSVNFRQLHGVTFQQIAFSNGKYCLFCCLDFSYTVSKQCSLLFSWQPCILLLNITKIVTLYTSSVFFMKQEMSCFLLHLMDCISHESWLLPSMSYPIHYSLIILLSEAR